MSSQPRGQCMLRLKNWRPFTLIACVKIADLHNIWLRDDLRNWQNARPI